MFQAIRKWWNGLWEKEESPGPKISKANIERVKETIEEIRSGKFDRAKPTGTDAQCVESAKAGQLKPFRREHVESEAVRIKGKPLKIGVVSRLTIQRGVDGPVETEIVNSKCRTITRGNATTCVDENGGLLPVGDLDFDGHMEPIPNPSGRKILPMMEMSFIAEPSIRPFLRNSNELEETVAERLADPKPVPVSLDELCPDTPVPAQRKPRRRGKRGGVKRNNRNKKK